MAELNKIPFGNQTCMSPGNRVLDEDTYEANWQMQAFTTDTVATGCKS